MRTSPMLRLVVMGMILIALLVPLAMTSGVVAERTSRRDNVANEIARALVGAGVRLHELRVERASLEDVFLQLTNDEEVAA